MMRILRYRAKDGIVGYTAGDLLVDDSGTCLRAVHDGRGTALVPVSVAYRVGRRSYLSAADAADALLTTAGHVEAWVDDEDTVTGVQVIAAGWFDPARDGETAAARLRWLQRLVAE